LDSIEPRAQIEQQLRVEAGADLAGEHEFVLLEIPDEQRAEADAPPLRIGEAADDELLRRLAFHLQPVRRAAVLVGRAAPLRDHAFPALATGAFPRLRLVNGGDARERPLQRQRAEQRAPLLERQRGDVAALEPQDVEYVIRAAVPRELAVEDRIPRRQRADGVRDGGQTLRE